MTDDSTDLATKADGEPFILVPSPSWAHDIEARLNTLEQHHADTVDQLPADVPPAGLTPEQEEQILTALKGIDTALTSLRTDLDGVKDAAQGRLDRHRTAIEELTEHQNALLDILKKNGLVPTAGSPL